MPTPFGSGLIPELHRAAHPRATELAYRLLQPFLFGEDFLGVLARRIRQCPVVELQTRLEAAGATNIFLENARSQSDIDHRIEHRLFSTVLKQLVEVMSGNHLHQTFGAHQALGYRIEARLDRHYRENQQGIQAHLPTGIVGSAHKLLRSEERRVGKECRSRWSPYH